MRRVRLLGMLFFAVGALLVVACGGNGQDSPSATTTAPAANTAAAASSTPTASGSATRTDDPVLLALGDIGTCSDTADEAVAALAASLPGTIAAVGDIVYDSATADEFARCFDPAWGALKGRIRPALGNHDYGSGAGAPAYFAYFGEAAGPVGKGWYSYDVGSWHVVVLNSNCETGECAAGSEQEQWLKSDLASHANACTLAYWHHPRFTSGLHGDMASLQPLWQDLYSAGADILLTGHDHHYERFEPLDAQGKPDDAHGIREFIVGTGGAELYPLLGVHPGSEVRNTQTHGLLKLTLHEGGYDWEFLPVKGSKFTDKGSGSCHAQP